MSNKVKSDIKTINEYRIKQLTEELKQLKE